MRGRLLLPEEGAARHGVHIGPVARLRHILVAGVETSNTQNLFEGNISGYLKEHTEAEYLQS